MATKRSWVFFRIQRGQSSWEHKHLFHARSISLLTSSVNVFMWTLPTVLKLWSPAWKTGEQKPSRHLYNFVRSLTLDNKMSHYSDINSWINHNHRVILLLGKRECEQFIAMREIDPATQRMPWWQKSGICHPTSLRAGKFLTTLELYLRTQPRSQPKQLWANTTN